MNITLTLGDFLAIAAIVVIFARGAHAYFAAPSPEQLRMQRQLDAIMKHLGLDEPPASRPGAPSPQVVALVAAGRKIEAIKLYRQETGEGLKQARAAYFSPSWTAFQADRGRCFSVIVDGVSV